MVENAKTQKERVTIPYAPWRQVKQFLANIRVLNPKTIDENFLRANQMGGQSPGPLLATIQFIGLIGADGTPTAKLESLRVRGDELYQNALADIVREAYHDLFGAVDVEAAGRDLLYNQIRSVYGCSTRIAETATPLFIALCREANMNVGAASSILGPNTGRSSAQVGPRARQTRNGGGAAAGIVASTAKERFTQREVSSQSFGPALHIDVQIHIDSTASAEQIDQIFASMARHIYKKHSD